MNDSPPIFATVRRNIQIIEPLLAAWPRMKLLLFSPFLMERWLVLGFTAWLGAVAGGGGGSFQVPTNFGDTNFPKSPGEVFGGLESWVITLIAVTAVIVLVLVVVWSWLSARFRFIFLENLIQTPLTGRVAVAEPWRRFSPLGNSLFLWSLLLSFGMLALLLIPVAMVFALGGIGGEPNCGLILLLLAAALVVGLPLVVAFWLLNSFVVPVMYKSGLRTLPAAQVVLGLVRQHLGPCLLYFLFNIALSIGLGMGVLLVGFGTCCIGFILLALPYVGAVFMLPVSVTLAYYNLEFLRQFGPDYDLLTNTSPPQTDLPPPPPLSEGDLGPVSLA